MDDKLKQYVLKYMEICKIINERGQKDRKVNFVQRKALKSELNEILWVIQEVEGL